MVDEYLFTPTQSEMSSGYRELLAIWHSFKVYDSYFKKQKGKIIVWITDSSCLVSFLNKGSRIRSIQKILIEIKKKEYQYGLKIKPQWVTRNDINLKIADLGSKLHLASDDFGLGHSDFLHLQEIFNCRVTIDAMATSKSKRCEKFISIVPQQGAIDTDFFMHKCLMEDVYYWHPPVKTIIRLLNRIRLLVNIKGLLVLPFWESGLFWVYLTKNGFFDWFVKSYYIFSPLYISFAKNCASQGYKNFRTIVIQIDTSAKHNIKSPF